jgi:hypothetical protein
LLDRNIRRWDAINESSNAMHHQVRLPERLAFAVVTASAVICAVFFFTHRNAADVDGNTWTISAYFPSLTDTLECRETEPPTAVEGARGTAAGAACPIGYGDLHLSDFATSF